MGFPRVATALVGLALALSASATTVCPPGGGEAALVVIDMQPIFVERGGHSKTPENRKKVERITAAQVAAIKRAREFNLPIVMIEYAGMGSTNDTLKKALKGYGDVHFFEKDTDGMLDDDNKGRQKLVEHLRKKNIGTLIVTGANGGACVEQSIGGSLKNNCSVVAVSYGIADFNYQDFIYPYANQYTGYSKPDCVDCTFREVRTFNDALKAIGIGNGRQPARTGGGTR